MASTFPAAIANEPPPLGVSSDEEDSEEYRSHGLKLDVPSGEPTPVSTPFKRPCTKSPDNGKGKSEPQTVAVTDLEENDETILEIIPSEVEFHSAECSPYKTKSQSVLLPVENGEHSSQLHGEVNGISEEITDSVAEVVEDVENNPHAPVDQCTWEDDNVPSSASESSAADDCDTDDVATNKNGIEHFQECDSSVLDEAHEHDKDESQNRQHPQDQEAPFSQEFTSQSITSIITGAEETSFDEVKITQDDDNDTNVSEFQTFESAHAKPLEPCEVVKNDRDENKPVPVSQQETEEENEVDEDDDFGTFQTIPDSIQSIQVPQVTSEPNVPYNDGFDDDDDDFGDFAQVPAPVVTPLSTPQAVAQASANEGDDFADFQDCSFQSCDVPALVSTPSLAPDSPFLFSKIDSIVKSLFAANPTPEKEDANLRSIDSEISISTDSTWRRVQDFEGSQGLMFKWLNSITEKELLKSLNIDNSTIMYHEKWGTIEVPKFAASLVQSPLQPQSCNNADPHNKSDVHHHSVVVNNNNNITQDTAYQPHDKKNLKNNNTFFV